MKRCQWPGCNGVMQLHTKNPNTGELENQWRCLYCGRTDDLIHEQQVRLAQQLHDLSGLNVSIYETKVATFNRPNRRKKNARTGPHRLESNR